MKKINPSAVILIVSSIIILLGLFYVTKTTLLDRNSTVKNQIEAGRDNGLSELSGGYLPTEEIVINNYKIAVIEVRIEPEGKSSEVYLRLRNVNDSMDIPFLKCHNPLLTKEKLITKFEKTPIGNVLLDGKFLPKQGQEWGMPPGTLVLQGKLTITDDNEKIIYSKEQDFTFTYGE